MYIYIADSAPGYEKSSSYEGGYHPCYAWDMIGWMTTSGEYISPVYY
jgi:hypothetical protein